MHKAALPPPPFEGSAQVVKFLVVNTNVAVVLEYTSDEVREHGYVACGVLRLETYGCWGLVASMTSLQREVATQVVSVALHRPKM